MRYRIPILFLVSIFSVMAWADRPGHHPGRGPGKPVERRKSARLGAPVVRGSGCPDGSVSVTLSPDESAVSLIFDKYRVEAGGGGRGGLNDMKKCDFLVPMDVPAGWSLTVNRVDYRGFNSLPEGGTSEFRSVFGISAGRGQRTSTELRQPFVGPLDSDFLLSQTASDTIYSACGESIQLTLRTQLRIQTNAAREQAMATVDSADLNSERQTVYYLTWKQCQ